MNDYKILVWAKDRVDLTANNARLANNAARTAARDLEGVKRQAPTPACLSRYHDWLGRQPK